MPFRIVALQKFPSASDIETASSLSPLLIAPKHFYHRREGIHEMSLPVGSHLKLMVLP
jgi:hypothetical protein